MNDTSTLLRDTEPAQSIEACTVECWTLVFTQLVPALLANEPFFKRFLCPFPAGKGQKGSFPSKMRALANLSLLYLFLFSRLKFLRSKI